MEEELEVLEAILGQALKVEKDILRLTIQMEARLGQLTKLVWHRANLEEASSNEGKCVEILVDYLPPVNLLIQLTPAYPAFAPPEGRIQADWLPSKERERLAELLIQVWNKAEGEVVIWDWVQVGVWTKAKGQREKLTFPGQGCSRAAGDSTSARIGTD